MTVRSRRFTVLLLVAAIVLPLNPWRPALAQDGCRRAVLVALPGVTWEHVERFSPPTLMSLVSEGATGALAVRTNSSWTSLGSGFATIGAGTRTEAGDTVGNILGADEASASDDGLFARAVEASGLVEMLEIAESADYHPVPGALGEAIDEPLVAIGNGDAGLPPPLLRGSAAFVLLATMDTAGVTDLAAVGTDLLQADRGAPLRARRHRTDAGRRGCRPLI